MHQVDLVTVATLAADGRVFEVGWVLGDPSAGKTSLVGPVVRILGLPCPLDPSLSAALVCDDLCLPVLAKEGLVARAERRGTAGQAAAASDFG